MHKRWLLFALSVAVCLTLSAAGRRRAVRHPSPADGPCEVRGLANLYYSTDGGTTWSRNVQPATTDGVWDLIVLDSEPESLVAVVGHDLYDSNDAGCTWTLRHTITQDIHHTVHLVPGAQGRAFLWTEEFALRYDNGEVITLPIQSIGGLGANPGNREHVRMLDLVTGNARESFDGGMTWSNVGGSASGLILAAAFDPTDFQHILAGVQQGGIKISRNGGKNWSAGATPSRNVCFMSFVAGQPNVVWVTIGSRKGDPWVQRSTDGGAHLEGIAGIDALENNVCMPVLTNPRDATRAIVSFRDFYVFDAVQKNVTTWTCCAGRMDRIAYSLKDPARVYVYSGLR